MNCSFVGTRSDAFALPHSNLRKREGLYRYILRPAMWEKRPLLTPNGNVRC